MSDYDNTNRWTLFVNDRKQKDADADRTGTINIDGKEYYLNGWLRESKAGAKFLSGTVKLKGATTQKPEVISKPAADFHDDVPF